MMEVNERDRDGEREEKMLEEQRDAPWASSFMAGGVEFRTVDATALEPVADRLREQLGDQGENSKHPPESDAFNWLLENEPDFFIAVADRLRSAAMAHVAQSSDECDLAMVEVCIGLTRQLINILLGELHPDGLSLLLFAEQSGGEVSLEERWIRLTRWRLNMKGMREDCASMEAVLDDLLVGDIALLAHLRHQRVSAALKERGKDKPS